MPSFSYRAISNQGKTVQGAVTADRIELAARELRSQGLTLLSLEPGAAKGTGSVDGAGGPGGAGSDQVLALTRELAVLLRAGLPIDRALKVMIDMAAEAPLREMLEAVERDLITRALGFRDGHVTRTAADLGLERSHLYKKMRALGIHKPGAE